MFTTRPETLPGVAFLALSAQHPLALGGDAGRGKRTTLVAVNPLTGTRVPVFVADYVLAGTGTGAVMGVPAHDERDASFAKDMGLAAPYVRVLGASGDAVECDGFVGSGEDSLVVAPGACAGHKASDAARFVVEEVGQA